MMAQVTGLPPLCGRPRKRACQWPPIPTYFSPDASQVNENKCLHIKKASFTAAGLELEVQLMVRCQLQAHTLYTENKQS